jgi:hypothetical protein
MFCVMCENHDSGKTFLIKETGSRPSVANLHRMLRADLTDDQMGMVRNGTRQRAGAVSYWVAKI